MTFPQIRSLAVLEPEQADDRQWCDADCTGPEN
jgi:hypothetical protein